MVVASDTHQILVVDDDPNILNLIRQILEDYEDAGVHIMEARDGQSAMQLVRRHRPDLVFLDVNLGDISGGIICQLLKKHLDSPIVLVTALDQDDPKVPPEADVYIVKPFSAEQILAVVGRYLPLPA